MIIALIISLFINFIFLVTSQDCSNCVVFRMVQEKNEKIKMLEDIIKGVNK